MKELMHKLGWIYFGLCACQGGGWKFRKDGKDYTVTIYYTKHRFAIIKNDMVKRAGHNYDLEKTLTEYEQNN